MRPASRAFRFAFRLIVLCLRPPRPSSLHRAPPCVGIDFSFHVFKTSEPLAPRPCATASLTPGNFSDGDVTKWMMQTAQGLQYLHSRRPSVVHRDLKLANLMLDDRRGALRCDRGAERHFFFVSAHHRRPHSPPARLIHVVAD